MLHVWNIYLHLPQKWPSHVGKYSSTMEHLGTVFSLNRVFMGQLGAKVNEFHFDPRCKQETAG